MSQIFDFCPEMYGKERWAIWANAFTSDVCEPVKSMFSEREECTDFFVMVLLGVFLRSHFNVNVLPHDLAKLPFTDI